MRLLLDTHILLWVLAGSSKIKGIAPRLLDEDNQVYFSVASLWEIAIKSGLKKLDVDVAEVRQAAKASGFEELPVLGQHIEGLLTLAAHHRDPFDRLLIAQAATEPMRLLTADVSVAQYGAHVELIWQPELGGGGLMGREAQTCIDFGGQRECVKALLEGDVLMLRGAASKALPRSLPLARLQQLQVQGEALVFHFGGVACALELGAAEAAKWLKKIQAGPPSLASKLGISREKPAAVFGPVDADEALASALEGACTSSAKQASLLLALVQSQQALDQALALHAAMPCQALWLVYEKGPKAVFGEGLIRSHLRSLGYRDNKSCAVSERLTATRYLKP